MEGAQETRDEPPTYGCTMLTIPRCGCCCWVAPVTPDTSFLGTIDAKWIATHLHKINSAGPQPCQSARGLIPHVIHNLLGNSKRVGGSRELGVLESRPTCQVLRSSKQLPSPYSLCPPELLRSGASCGLNWDAHSKVQNASCLGNLVI